MKRILHPHSTYIGNVDIPLNDYVGKSISVEVNYGCNTNIPEGNIAVYGKPEIIKIR